MIRFIRNLIQAYNDAKLVWIYNPDADDESVWTQEDSEQAQQFFASSTGTKMKVQLANYYVRASMEANKVWQHHKKHLGIAFGMWLMLQFIENRAKNLDFRESQHANMGKFKVPEAETAADDLALL